MFLVPFVDVAGDSFGDTFAFGTYRPDIAVRVCYPRGLFVDDFVPAKVIAADGALHPGVAEGFGVEFMEPAHIISLVEADGLEPSTKAL